MKVLGRFTATTTTRTTKRAATQLAFPSCLFGAFLAGLQTIRSPDHMELEYLEDGPLVTLPETNRKRT